MRENSQLSGFCVHAWVTKSSCLVPAGVGTKLTLPGSSLVGSAVLKRTPASISSDLSASFCSCVDSVQVLKKKALPCARSIHAANLSILP